MSEKKLLTRVRTFATSANLGPGYDCAGLALNIYNEHEVYLSDLNSNCVSIKGSNDYGIEKDDNNLICRTIKKVIQKKFGLKFDTKEIFLEIKCKINVPVGRGLGSSSTAIVAGLLIANKIYNLNLSKKEMLNIGVEIEPHPDNLASCISGGLTICYKNKNNEFDFEKIKIKRNFKVLLMIPNYKINTNEARKLIPNSFPKEDVVSNIANFALLINSMISGDFERAPDFIDDKIHQPYRRKIYENSFSLMIELINKYELPAAISGSGPTVFAIIPKIRQEEFELKILEKLKSSFPDFKFKLTSVNERGSYCY